jgi:hypothetical protein
MWRGSNDKITSWGATRLLVLPVSLFSSALSFAKFETFSLDECNNLICSNVRSGICWWWGGPVWLSAFSFGLVLVVSCSPRTLWFSLLKIGGV